MRNSTGIAGRYFLVGCERSGTTLLQAMLARHSRVFSFPESHFFCRAVPRQAPYRVLGIARWRRARVALGQLLGLLERHDLARYVPRYSPFLVSYVRAFRRIVDRATLDRGKNIWVEKTPHHLYQIPSIQRFIPDAGFIHLLRDGRDVAASIRDASLQDPDYWGQWSTESLAQWWNKAIERSLKYRHNPRHILISYEALIDDPRSEVERVCDFLHVQFEPEMLRHWEGAEGVVGWIGARTWGRKPFGPLEDTRLKKFTRVFSVQERYYLDENLLWGGEVGRVLTKARNSVHPCTIEALSTTKNVESQQERR